MRAISILESEIFKGKSERQLYHEFLHVSPLYAKIISFILTNYKNWSRQISSSVEERHYLRFDPSPHDVSFNYMRYRIHYESGNVMLGISNQDNRYDYYVIKDIEDFINLITYKTRRPPIEPARKNIRESIEDVFKPKSEEEIDKNLENDPDYKIEGQKTATEHLLAAINRKNLPYAKYAIRHGAKAFNSFNPKTGGSSGNLWAAYNSMGDSNESQDLIIEILKSKQVKTIYKKHPKLRQSILQKTLYMGMVDVMKWILANFKETTYQDVHIAIQNVGIDWGSSTWSGYQETLDMLIPWLGERKPIKESVESILKPKPANEIDTQLRNYSPVFYQIYQEVNNNPAYTDVEIHPRRTLGGSTGFTLDFHIEDYHFEVIINKDKDGERKQIVIRHTPPSKIFFLDSVRILNLREFNYYISRALEEENPLKESMNNILKPKSRSEIQQALGNTEYDEYVDMVDREIEFIHSFIASSFIRQRVAYGDDLIFSQYRNYVEEGFKEKTPPFEVAQKIIESYYQNNWKPDGGLALTNTGGMEIKLIDTGDGVEYRYTGEIIPKGAEIQYDYRDDEDQDKSGWISDEEDEREVKAFFEDENGEKWYLEDFMRIDYPRI